ncbi:hypothetical protein, partial [Paracoccus halophilus]|uniref:hypothetical protein n=1 Tax=Paracoccus halophilus TaxID=376733 RepID=UPI001E3A967B
YNDQTARISLQISRNVKKHRNKNNQTAPITKGAVKPSCPRLLRTSLRRWRRSVRPFQRLAVSVSGYLRMLIATRKGEFSKN